tara:strand:+ start:5698 stop:5991 length:294 start_codon:yes stop_codon:yes gene_type:complete
MPGLFNPLSSTDQRWKCGKLISTVAFPGNWLIGFIVIMRGGNAKAGEKSKQSLDTIVTQGETKTISVVRVAAVSPEKSKHTKPGCPIPQLSFGMLIK